LSKPERRLVCIDGDGAALMHLGSLAIIGSESPKNFKHIVINNGAHDSVGGQPTVGFKVSLISIAKSCGYKEVFKAETSEEVKEAITNLESCEGPAMLEIKVNKGSRSNLGRPTIIPIKNKKEFMKFLKK